MIKIYRNSKARREDTFRELLGMWEESGYCELKESADLFCWVDGVGEVLLYDHPRFDHLPNSWKFALFANMQMEGASPWIFWARHPRKLEQSIKNGIPSYSERDVVSIFLGKIENQTQLENRIQYDWRSCIERFSMPILMGDSINYPISQEEYLNSIKHSKFGLCLPGYGPKCNREIEYLGSGTVPIYTDGCGLEYYDGLEEGVHYLKADNPPEIRDMLSNISEKEWKELSENGREWYEKNCSRKGSFDTTQKILEEVTCEH